MCEWRVNWTKKDPNLVDDDVVMELFVSAFPSTVRISNFQVSILDDCVDLDSVPSARVCREKEWKVS